MKTLGCGMDTMDWMVQVSSALPKKCLTKKSKGDARHPYPINSDGIASSQIPDLNESPSPKQCHISPVRPVKKRGPGKEKSKESIVDASVTTHSPKTKPAKKGSRAKVSSPVPHAVLSYPEKGLPHLAQSDRGPVIDAAMPKKCPTKKYAPRKKKNHA